jgi:hypothetical protein
VKSKAAVKAMRVQLSRRKGWHMPANAVKVDRTTRFGNPYDVREYGVELALRLFEDSAVGCWLPANIADADVPTREMLHEAHCRWIRRFDADPVDAIRKELRGKHLACWCRLPKHGEEDTCHAAILLRIANRRCRYTGG